MSIRSFNYPGHRIVAVPEGTEYVGKIAPELTVGAIYINKTEGLYTDGKGSNEQRVSFVEVGTDGNPTNRYLRYDTGNKKFYLKPLTDSDSQFKKEATFVVVEPKEGKKEDGFVSYQSRQGAKRASNGKKQASGDWCMLKWFRQERPVLLWCLRARLAVWFRQCVVSSLVALTPFDRVQQFRHCRV